MLRTLLLLGSLMLLAGCSKAPELDPPDAPEIPPSTRSTENPGLPTPNNQPNQPKPVPAS